MSTLHKSETFPSGLRLEIVEGDMLSEAVDAIVNAANEQLSHGGGVAAAISRRGGPQIQEESDAWVRQHGPLPHERPPYTGGGSLPCRYVIHAVGPVWHDGRDDEDVKLAACVRGALALADELKLQSIAFPAISTGIFGYPKHRAARIMLETMRAYFAARPASGLQLVHINLTDTPTLAAFLQAWDAQHNKA